MNAWAIVVAAGRGARTGLSYNKVFHPLAGRSVLSRALEALAGSGAFAGIVLALNPLDRAAYEDLIAREGACPLVKYIADGGATRQDTVANALALVPAEAEIVAVHDAARPFVTGALVRETVASARRAGSGVACTPVTDTIKTIDGRGCSTGTLPRPVLRAVQTPQTFRAELLREAYARAAREGYASTDDAALVEKFIGPVQLIEHPDGAKNQKITTLTDILEAEARMTKTPRIGCGCDAHRLVEGRKLILLGVEIPYERGLLGHSDADVAAHALMDALLGALGLGDIGKHFPDSDPAYRGISSMLLLRRVMELVEKNGYRVGNADITIVAQKPKLAPYMEAMKENMMRALDTPAVSVKATTTEGMGYEGRGEGISATAAALLV